MQNFSQHSNAATDMPAFTLTKPVFLIGFMGAGKTSVARKLARVCGLASVDVDTYIERHEGKSIKDIFAEVGEEGFRKIETYALRQICDNLGAIVVSCGGGIVTTPENIEIMRNAGLVVYLQVTAEQASERIGNKSTRPLFNDIESARERLARRTPLYESAADVVINTQNKSVGGIMYDVRHELEQKGILCQQQK